MFARGDLIDIEDSHNKITSVEVEHPSNRSVEDDANDESTDLSTTEIKRHVFIICIAALMLACVLLIFAGSGDSKKVTEKSGAGHLQGELIVDGNRNSYQILGAYKRTTIHYTQGLYWDNGRLIESGGIYGQSSVHYLEVDEDSKKIVQNSNTRMDGKYFGEGLDKVPINGSSYILQLTWRENKIMMYDTDMNLVKEFDKPDTIVEGWGITHRPSSPCDLIISDSTDTLKIMDCQTMKVKESLTIRKGDYTLPYMNELEFVGDYLFANVYLTKNIEIIDLESKTVVRTLDMSVLLDRANAERDSRGLGQLEYLECLNGIAYDEAKKELWITGKDWPLFFKIKLPEEYLKKPTK